MDTNVFKALLEIESCKNITHAARHAFISQPALTKQLNKLEKEIGMPLFDRSHSPVEPTPQGEIFLDFVRKYLELEEDLRRDLGLSQEAAVSPVRIAMTHRGGNYVGSHTAVLMEQHSELHLEYLDMTANQCETALDNESVDLAVYTDPVLNAGLEYMPLEEDPLVFVIPEDSPILSGLDLSGNSLTQPVEIPARRFRDPQLRYILSTPGQGLYYAEKAFFKKYHVKEEQCLRVDYVDTRYQVVCSGCGIAMFPHITIRSQSKVPEKKMIYGIPAGDYLYRYVIVARKKGRSLSAEAETVWHFLVNRSLHR